MIRALEQGDVRAVGYIQRNHISFGMRPHRRIFSKASIFDDRVVGSKVLSSSGIAQAGAQFQLIRAGRNQKSKAAGARLTDCPCRERAGVSVAKTLYTKAFRYGCHLQA